MKVWVVKTSEMLAEDNSSGRLMRSGLIAHMLDARGHVVTWWTSTFDHANRRQRVQHDAQVPFGSRGVVRMLRSPGYDRSVSLGRLKDHILWGARFKRAIQSEEAPELIFCAYPTIEAASVSADFGRRRNIPVVIDLRDMWPDIFTVGVPALLRPTAQAALWPLYAKAGGALRGATALFAITDEFLAWGLKRAGRARGRWDSTFAQAYPVTNPPTSKHEEAAARRFWDQHELTRSATFNVALVGTITGRRIEMEAVLEAARSLREDQRPVRFIIAGAGDDLEKYRRLGRDCQNVLFSGWLTSAQIKELLSRAHIGLIPYRSTPDYISAVPTKAAEYFAAGVPVATCLQGVLPGLLQRWACGLVFDAAAPTTLVEQIRKLRDDSAQWSTLSLNAVRTYQDQFVAETVYARLVDRLEEIVAATRRTPSHVAGAAAPAS